MKTIQKLVVLAAVLAMAGLAKADALYWQVDTGAADASYAGEYAYAALYASDGSLLDGYNAALNDSGAFYRDAERWNRPNAYSENYNIYSYAAARFEMMDRRIAEMTSEALRGRRLRIQGYTTFDEGPLSYE